MNPEIKHEYSCTTLNYRGGDMKANDKSTIQLFLILSIFFFIALFQGCSLFSPLSGAESGMELSYNMPADKNLKYSLKNESKQNMEIRGQSIETSSNMECLFSVESKGNQDDNHKLGITIDDMNMRVNSPQGEITPDMSAVLGKAFEMTLTKLGKELNWEGAESIRYKLGQAGERSIAPNFQSFFPDLPDKPVNVGDSWITYDTLRIKEANSDLLLIFESKNTLKRYENVNGMNCAKIEAEVKGKMTGTGNQMGVDLNFDGTIKGTDVWHFAHEEGLLVKSESNSVTDATIMTSGVQTMTIPMTTSMKITTELVE